MTFFWFRKVVIDFTAAWCKPCQSMEPTLEELATKYKDICIVKIDVDELPVYHELQIYSPYVFYFIYIYDDHNHVTHENRMWLRNMGFKQCLRIYWWRKETRLIRLLEQRKLTWRWRLRSTGSQINLFTLFVKALDHVWSNKSLQHMLLSFHSRHKKRILLRIKLN